MSDLLEQIKKLRELSGAGFLDCKKALSENNNDIEKSIDFLRKKGLIKASKKSSREANEGAVGIFTDKNKAILIEINTETDFAAKNSTFLEFFDLIGKFALEKYKNNSSEDSFKDIVINNKKISDYFTDIIAKIGENIVLKKIKFIPDDNDCKIFTYTHNSYKKNIGKICVVLKAKIEKDNNEADQFGKNLCMHIAATNPLSLDKESLDKKIIEREKNVQLETIKSSGKPENIINKILEGKMNKFYSEVILLNQFYIMDNEKTIQNVIDNFSNNNKFEIKEYSIFVLGS